MIEQYLVFISRIDKEFLKSYNVNEIKNIHSYYSSFVGGLPVEDKKAIIYDCAKALFSTKGFKETNISEITKQAGMAVGTFYNSIPLKKSSLWIFFWKKTQR